jgi:anti-sigma B factor antagonist
MARSGARCGPVTTTVSGVSELGAQLDISATSTGWKLAGEIDAHTAPELATAMVQLPPGDVIVDLGDVSFMDSSGLRVLIDVAARAREAGGDLIIAHPTPGISRLVEISGLSGQLRLDQ